MAELDVDWIRGLLTPDSQLWPRRQHNVCAHIIRNHIKGNTWVDLFDVLDLMALYMENWSTTSIQYDKLKTIENAYDIEIQVFSFKLMTFVLQSFSIFESEMSRLKCSNWRNRTEKKTEFAFFVCSNSYSFAFCDFVMHSAGTWHPDLGANFIIIIILDQ